VELEDEAWEDYGQEVDKEKNEKRMRCLHICNFQKTIAPQK
jgi:hypothetical protein